MPNNQPDKKIIAVDEYGVHFQIIHPGIIAKAMIPKLSIFPGRRFTYKPFPHWLIPVTVNSASRIMEFAQDNGYEVKPKAVTAFSRMMEAKQAAEPSPATEDRYLADGQNKAGKKAICVYWGQGPEFQAIYNTVSLMEGSQYMGHKLPRHFAVSETTKNAAALLKLAAQFHFSIPESIKARLTALIEESMKVERTAALKKKVLIDAALDIPTTSFGGKTVRDYQLAGVSFMLNAIGRYSPTSGVIEADQVGLGKTFQAMLIARCYQRAISARVIIVCPKSLMGDWLIEAKACGVQVEVCSWQKIPKPTAAPYIVIADECHYMQDSKSQRSQAMTELVQASTCQTFIAVSATPMRGMRPKNLFPILRAIGHPLAKDRDEYEKRFCNKRLKTIGGRSFWDSNGSAHLDELMREIAPVFLQRLKKDVLKQLPPLTIQPRQVEISAEAKALYEKVFKDAQAKFQARRLATEQKIKEAMAKGKKLEQIEFTKDDAREGAEAVVLLGHLRRAASIAMIEPTLELAGDVLDQGEKVLIYSEYPEVCEKIAEHFRGAGIAAETLTGQVEAIERDRAKERFQRGSSRVFCLTKAGGVGLTLTAASNAILVDQPWMWDDVIQIAGRLHRLDEVMNKRIQANGDVAVNAYLLKGFEINDKIQARLFEQRDITEKIERGDRSTMRGVKSVNELAKEIAQELFGQQAKAKAA